MANSGMAADAPPSRSASGSKLIGQGEDDLYFQSWYPLCLSSELPAGQVRGLEFLGGRVIAFRDETGNPSVMGAYCRHLGADLSLGRLVDGHLQCPFHRWQYDTSGKCVRTGIGDPPPPTRLFKFPAQERFGLIWAFNGTDPLWPLPDFAYPDTELEFHNYVTEEYACDGWVFACNTPDWQHIKLVHEVKFANPDIEKSVEWTKWGHSFPIRGTSIEPGLIDWRVGITGVSIYRQEGTVDNWWLGLVVAFSCPRPGFHKAFGAIALHKGDGSPETVRRNKQSMEWAMQFGARVAQQDWQILNTIHYRRGALTKSDRMLAKYMDFLAAYPRAHPSADYIR